MSKPEALLVPLSGGLDSTYLMYKLAKDNPNDSIIPFHISMKKSGEAYWREEDDAADNIVRWFRNNKFPNVQGYKKTSIDMRNFPPGYDTDGVLLMAAKYAYSLAVRNKHSSIKLFIGLIGDDGPLAQKRNVFEGIGVNIILWRSLLNSMKWRLTDEKLETIDRDVYYPLWKPKKLFKVDIAPLLPKSLLNLIWVCRNPRNGLHCGRCTTCRQTRHATEGLEWERTFA